MLGSGMGPVDWTDIPSLAPGSSCSRGTARPVNSSWGSRRSPGEKRLWDTGRGPALKGSRNVESG